jgi:hypothetical protein
MDRWIDESFRGNLYTITVDTEEQWDWSSGFTTDTQGVSNIQGLPRFQKTCEALGAKVTYFVNYAVLANKESRDVIAQLSQNPMAEIGLHYHPWNTPPLSPERFVPSRDSYLANLDWTVARAKLESVLEGFERLGIKPTSFRGGRYSTSEQIQQYLYSKGILADYSFMPYCRWSDDGAPDYSRRGYRAIRKAFSQQRDGFWELPLTRGFTRFDWDFMGRLFLRIESSPWNKLRLIGILERLRVCERVWLNFEEMRGGANIKLLPALVRKRMPYINFTLHSSSLVAGCNSYVPDGQALEELYRNLENFLQPFGSSGVYRAATVTELVGALESHYLDRANRS